jgi:hypothetical protein
MNTMGINAFNDLLMGMFQGPGQTSGQSPGLPQTQTTPYTMPDGSTQTYTEGPASPAMQNLHSQYQLAEIENALNDMGSPGIVQDPQPPPIESNVQSELQPEGLIDPSYQGPAETPSNSEPTPQPQTSDQTQDSSTPVYDTITKELLSELQSGGKKNWGEAMGLAALAFSNPALAQQVMQASDHDRQQLKAMLLQAGGQEMSLKRAEAANISAENRQAKRDEAAFARQDAKLEEARLDPIRRAAGKIGFDVEAYRNKDGTYDTARLNADFGKAQSDWDDKDNYVKMLSDAKGKLIDTSGLEKYSPENAATLMQRVSAWNAEKDDRERRRAEAQIAYDQGMLGIQQQRLDIARSTADSMKESRSAEAEYTQARAQFQANQSALNAKEYMLTQQKFISALETERQKAIAASGIGGEASVAANLRIQQIDAQVRAAQEEIGSAQDIAAGRPPKANKQLILTDTMSALGGDLSRLPIIPADGKSDPLGYVALHPEMLDQPQVINLIRQHAAMMDSAMIKNDIPWQVGQNSRDAINSLLLSKRPAYKPQYSFGLFNYQNMPGLGAPPAAQIPPPAPTPGGVPSH